MGSAAVMIEFTVMSEPSPKMRDMGCGGMLVTKAKLTPLVIEALNKFWAENSGRFEDGDTFTIDVKGYDA
jgi:hypothetical protein